MLSVISRLNLIFKTCSVLLFFSTFFTIAEAKSTSDFLMSSDQIPYFKSPTSQYPSGETNLDRLEEALIEKVVTESTYYVYKNQKISRSVVKALTARDLSSSENLKDLGFFITLRKTSFKLRPELNSNQIFTIKENVKFKALGFKNGFVLAQINQKLGYIDISECMSKFDFAKAAYAPHPKTKIKQWFYIKNRTFDQFETVDKITLSLANVEGIFPDSNKALVSSSDQSLPLWTSLQIKTDTNTNTWNRSQLKGHGIVYWQKKSALIQQAQNHLKIDDLLKKEISFVSFNPKNPRQAIASAKGLYITSDGENWSEIPQFKDYEGPVLFYNEFLIFVGNYKSIDGGKTFENYIQIEKLSGAISDRLGYDPKRLQVKKIKSIKPFLVEVDLDIGQRIIKVQTPVYSQDWKVIKI